MELKFIHFYRYSFNQGRYGTFVNNVQKDQSDLANGDTICLVNVPENIRHEANHLTFIVKREPFSDTQILFQTETDIIYIDDDDEDDDNKNIDSQFKIDPPQPIISEDDYEEGEPSNVDPSTLRQSIVERGPVAKVSKRKRKSINITFKMDYVADLCQYV